MTETHPGGDQAALQFMIVDFLAEILKFSDRPDQMGQFLARQLRELMGVRVVLMVKEDEAEGETAARLIAIEPPGAAGRFGPHGLDRLMSLQTTSGRPEILMKATASPVQAALLGTLGVTSMSATPLRVGDLRVGTLFCLDHLDFHRADDAIRLLDALSPVFALILRNTVHFESQELKALSQAAKYQALLATNLDGYAMVDGQGMLLDANEAYQHMTGYRIEELRALPVSALDASETQPEILQRTERMKRDGSDRFLSRHRRKDGSTFPVEISTTHVPGQDLIIAFIRDLTERVAAETALRESETHHRELLEMLGEGIAVIDPQETFTLANPALERIFGVAPGGLIGANLRRFLDEASWGEIRDRTLRRSQGQSESYEMRITRPDGETRNLHLTVTPRFDPQGRFTGSLSVVRDRTEELRTQETLRLAQKMESLGSLAGGVAHDLNNVLGAILGLASLHQAQAEADGPLQQNMATIIKACQRGGALVKGLLGFARQGLAEERHVDLNQMVKEQVALLERTTLQKVTLVVDLAPELLPILGDPAALSHALMNLCINGVDAMPAGGTLTLRTWNEAPGLACLEVADTGTGMSEAILRKAMDPFFTTKPVGKGTGLGLPMVYATVMAHKGRLDIQSQVGQGTRIRVTFPASAAERMEDAPGAAVQVPKAVERRSVLLVDDDELVRLAVTVLLEALGHAVAAAEGGEAALQALAAGLRPDIVILDMNMPGLDGADTLPRIRDLCPQVPILLATGRVDQSALDLVERFHGVTLLSKPFSMEELQDRLVGLPLGP